MGIFSGHTVLDVPLDLPVRFVLLGVLYLALQLRLRRSRAAAIGVAVLLATELFEVFAVHDLYRPILPDWGDLADILSGLTGIAAAEFLRRSYAHIRRPRRDA